MGHILYPAANLNIDTKVRSYYIFLRIKSSIVYI